MREERAGLGAGGGRIAPVRHERVGESLGPADTAHPAHVAGQLGDRLDVGADAGAGSLFEM